MSMPSTGIPVPPPELFPPMEEIADYMVVYQRHWSGDARLEVMHASLDGIIDAVKKVCDWGGMAYVYYPNQAGMLQLAHIEGQIEGLFK